MKNTNVFDADLNPILETASNEDLDVIIKYLEKKLTFTLTSHDAYKAHQPNHTKYADLIAEQLRDMGGNSFANIFRGLEGPAYLEIVQDVAKKLKSPFNKNASIQSIENSILETILEKALDSMTEDERKELLKEMNGKSNITGLGGASTAAFLLAFKAGGFFSYQLTMIIANQVARAVLGTGLMLTTNAAITRVAAIIAGPIGWIVAGLWTAVDLAGPAYKVTIPCVIQVAMIRAKASAQSCTSCSAMIPDLSARFCSSCGNNL